METNAQSVQIPPDQEITITLRALHWQLVMNAVQEMPYRLAQPVVQALTDQFSQSLAERNRPNAHNGNGVDYEIPQT